MMAQPKPIVTPGISDAAVTELLSQLVAIPSINPAFRQAGDPDHWFNEAQLGAFVADWLRDIGLDVETAEVEPFRPNVIARLRGTSAGPRMIWEGHLDTVQVAGMDSPFTPRVAAGRLRGRGAADDKACLVAFMLALRDLARDPPPGDVTFLAAMDEEYRFAGVAHYLKRGERYDIGIAGEPTELRVVRACKGCLRWYIDVLGTAAHSAKPHEGLNAIIEAQRLLAFFDAEMERRTEAHLLLGRATLVCTAFEAGDGPNTVPSKATLRFDYRFLPSERGNAVWHHFEILAQAFAAASDGVRVIVHPPFMNGSAMDVPEGEDVVALLGKICQAHGVDPVPVGVPFGSDATKMTDAGIPTVVFGPGNIDQAHARDEFVEIAQVTKAARMLAEAARQAARFKMRSD